MQREFYDGEKADLELAARVANQDPPRRRVVRYEDWQAVPPQKPRPTVGAQVGGLIYGLVWIAVVVALVFMLALLGARQLLGVDLLRMIGDYRDYNAQLQATATAQALATPLPTHAPAGDTRDTGASTTAPPPTVLPPTAAPALAAPVAPPEQAAPTEAPLPPTEAPTAAPTAAPPTEAPTAAPTAAPPTATPEPELACINGHVHRLFWNGLDLEDEGTSCGTW